MPLYDTPEKPIGRYTHAVTTPGEGDGNDVVYDNWIVPGKKIPVWDKFSYEKDTNTVGLPSPYSSPSPIYNPIPPNVESNELMLIARGVNPIGMSYWRNINQHKNQNILQTFLSVNDEITIFTIDKSSLAVLSERQLGIHHTGEGCYFSALNSDILFVPFEHELIKVNIMTGAREIVWTAEGDTNLWQCHSSYDEKIHSASIKNLNYNIIKWGININGNIKYYELRGDPDECQVDKSGKYLFVKENNYNRIITLETGAELIIQNESGALGHSDCGFGCAIGENDYSSRPGALDYIRFYDAMSQNMYSTGIWNMGYVSFSNAKPNIEVYNQKCLISTPNDLIVVRLDGTGRGIKVCSNLTQITENLSDDEKYKRRAKANLCPNGEFAAWTAFVDGSLNAYVVRVPSI